MAAAVRWRVTKARTVFALGALFACASAWPAEPAWWTAQKQACGLSAGMAYNSWNGQCNRGGGGAGGRSGLNSQQQMMLNAAQQMMPLVQQLVHNALYGDPEEAARRAQEDARIRELQQQAEVEALRNAGRAKQRILAMLKSPDPYQPPVLSTGSTSATPSLTLLKRGDGPAASPPTLALIKRGEGPDPNDAAAARAGSGFDSAGPIQAAALPPPPPTPPSTPVAVATAAQPAQQPAPQPDLQKVSAAGPATPKPSDPPRGAGRDDLLKALQAKLDQNARDQKFLDELLAALERAPKPDAALLAEVRRKHAANLRALEALGEEIAAAEYDPLQDARNAPPRSSAFARGFEAATLCYSQSAGPACINAGAQQAACVADYDAGYQVGEKQRKLIMAGAYRTGHAAGAAGQLANGPADPRAEGSCRIEWIETYNRGYMQARETMTKR